MRTAQARNKKLPVIRELFRRFTRVIFLNTENSSDFSFIVFTFTVIPVPGICTAPLFYESVKFDSEKARPRDALHLEFRITARKDCEESSHSVY